MSQMPTPEEALKIQAHYRKHPEWFFRNFLGFDPYQQQVEIANSIVNNRTTSVASCNSAGKTGISGCIVPWFLSSYEESIVVTTAPTWRQVKDLLWREINTRYEKAKVPLGGDKPNMVSWQISTNWFAVGVSSKDPNRIQGYHADSGHLLVIADEAAAIEEMIFEGIDAIMTSADCRFLMLGNPTSQTGRFRDSHKPNSIANRIKISAFDTPNFKINNIKDEQDLEREYKIDPTMKHLKIAYKSLVSPIWVYEKYKQWGMGSPMYQSRIRAEFPEVGENNLIPLSWIEKAVTNERLDKVLGLNLVDGDDAQEKLNDQIRKDALAEYIKDQDTIRGVDVAREGSDCTVITKRWANAVGFPKAYYKQKTTETAGRVWADIVNLPTDLTGVDVIGVGGGVLDQLHQLQEEQEALGHGWHAKIVGVDVNNKPTETPEGMTQMVFGNKRAELYWKLMKMFENDEIYLMSDDKGNLPEQLMDELSCIVYMFRGNKIFIEEKKDMKKRLYGKSPDQADSLMMTMIRTNINQWSLSSDEPDNMRDELEDDDDDWEPGRVSYTEEYDNGRANPNQDY